MINRSILDDLSEYKEEREERNLSENNEIIESNFFNPELNLDEDEEEDPETLNKKRYYIEPKTKVTKDSTSNSVNQETKIKKKLLFINKMINRSILDDLSEYKEEGNLSENNENIESNFFNPELNLDEEEEDPESLNKKLYFCEPKTRVTKDSTSNSVNQETKIKKNIFNTNKITEREREKERLRERERERERESSQQLLQNRRRRGRRPNAEIKIESQKNPKRKRLSRKFGRDNIITKNQTDFISNIIIVFNMILIFFGIKEKVKNIDYEIKKIRIMIISQN